MGPSTPRGTGAPAPELETATPGPFVDANRPDVKLGQNYRVSVDDATWQETARPRDRLRANLEAIRRLKALEASGADVTVEDLEAFARYSGMGDTAFGEAFPMSNKKNPDPEIQALGQELRALLTEAEYTATSDARLNAHYTRPVLIGHMWQALRRLGIENLDRIHLLEPSAGSGRFLGLMPDQLHAKTAMTAVELDSITGGLLRHLYPQADVHHGIGFEDAPIAKDSIDVAISNVPFGRYGVTDREYLNEAFITKSIANYFFKKTLDKLRPGGVIAFITSRLTLDGHAEDPLKLRRRLAMEGDLLLAVRLPRYTFPDTHVETDLIFMRKRETPRTPEEAGRQPWINTRELNVIHDTTGSTVTLHRNVYFDLHPDHLLGTEGAGSGQFGPSDYKLNKAPERPWDTALPEVLARLPENVLQPVDVQLSTRIDPNAQAEGAFTIRDGQLLVARSNKLVKPMFHVKDGAARVRAMLDLNQKGMDVLDLQRAGAPEAQLARAQQTLNQAYDRYVRKWGPLNDLTNRRVLGDDPRRAWLLGLENWDDALRNRWSGKGRAQPATAQDLAALKTDIFSKRLMSAGRTVDKAETPKDGLMISLNEHGKLDLARISSLTGKSTTEVADDLLAQGLIYLDPKGGVSLDTDPTKRNYVLADDYLSGNVRQKLKDAEQAAARNNWFQKNVDALLAAQPTDLLPSQISVELGVGWIPPSDVNQFAFDLLGSERYQDKSKNWFSYVPVSASWTHEREGEYWQDYAKRQQWGTRDRPAMSLIEHALNSQPTRVTDRDGHVMEDATRLAEAKKLEIRDEFRRWVWSDPERAGRLAAFYNENVNVYRNREWNGDHLTFEGSSDIGLYPHQKASVWRIIQKGIVLLAHEVGFGKTFTMAAAAMELRRLGLARKNLMVTPNAVVPQFAEQFRALYPQARLLVPTELDFQPERRNVLMARIATGDWDAVIIPQSQFSLLEMHPNTQIDMLSRDLREVEEIAQQYADEHQIPWAPQMEDVEGARAPGNADQTFKQLRTMVRQMKERIKKQRARLDKWQQAHVKGALTFEELGVDQLFVDEADLYKNLYFPTKMGAVKGLSNTHALRSQDMYDKVRWLREQQGGRGVVFATGTPISNSIAELWTMMRYLARDELERLGMQHFDAWARTYGQAYPSFETTITGDNKMLYRFSRFVNMPELSGMFQDFADVRMSVDVPEMEALKPRMVGWNGESSRRDVTIESTDWHKAYQKVLADRAAALDPMDRKSDNMLMITGDARKASLDPTLVGGPALPHSKLDQAADRIFDVWHGEKADRGTQLVFMDLGTPKDRASVTTDEYPPELKNALKGVTDEEQQQSIIDDYFDEHSEDASETVARDSVYQKLKNMLVARGIPEQEVMFIHQAKNKAQRQSLYDLVNKGEVRVLFGSTEKLGAGVNVQRRLAAIHHLDTPWRPRDIEQREGRILRQGNKVYGPVLAADENGAIIRGADGLPQIVGEGKGARVYTYITEWPFDAYLWSTVHAKWRAIKSMMRREVTERTIDEADEGTMDAARFRMIATGDPWGLRLLQVEDAGKTLRAQKRAWENAYAEAGLRLKRLPEQIALWTEDLAKVQQDAPAVAALGPRGTTWVIDGATYPRQDAGDHLLGAVVREGAVLMGSEAKTSPLGSVDGWPLVLEYGGMSLTRGREKVALFWLVVQGPSGETYRTTPLPERTEASGEGLMMRVENTRTIPAADVRRAQEGVARAQADLASAQGYLQQNQAWTQQAQLAANEQMQAMIRAYMAKETYPPLDRVPTNEDLEAAMRGEQLPSLADMNGSASVDEATAAAIEAQQPPAEPKFEQASTQIDLTGVPTLAEIAGGTYRPEDVIQAEDKPHLTLLYGVRPDSEAAIRQAVADLGPFDIKLGPTRHFPADADRPESDVVYASIEANDQLSALRKRLEDANLLAVEPTRAEYIPHVTLAYVQPGTGERYSGVWTNRMAAPIHVDRLSLTDTQGNPIEIRLGETPTPIPDTPVLADYRAWAQLVPLDTIREAIRDHERLVQRKMPLQPGAEDRQRIRREVLAEREAAAAAAAQPPAEQAPPPVTPEPLTPEGRAAAIATIQDFLVRSKNLARDDLEVTSVATDRWNDDQLRDMVGAAQAWLQEHPETPTPPSPIDNPPPLVGDDQSTALAQIDTAWNTVKPGQPGELRLTGAMVSPEDRARVNRYEKLLADQGYEVLGHTNRHNTTTITFDKPIVDPRPAWQQTRAEYRVETRYERSTKPKERLNYISKHREAIEAAIARGDLDRDSPEGQRILADYPELVRSMDAAEAVEKQPDPAAAPVPGDEPAPVKPTPQARKESMPYMRGQGDAREGKPREPPAHYRGESKKAERAAWEEGYDAETAALATPAPKPPVTPTPQIATGVDGTTKYVLPSFVTGQQRGENGRKPSPNQTPRPEGDAIAEPATEQAKTLEAELETPPAAAATVPPAGPTPAPAAVPPTAETPAPAATTAGAGGAPPTRPPAPPAPPTPPEDAGFLHRRRSGYWWLSSSGRGAVDRGWGEYGQVKEVMTHEAWLNEAAKLTGEDVLTIARAWRGVDPGRMAEDLTAMRAGVLQVIREMGDVKRDLDGGLGDQGTLSARLEDLAATYEELWLGMTRASTEHARALNSLRIQMGLTHLSEAAEFWRARQSSYQEIVSRLNTLVKGRDGRPLNDVERAEIDRLTKQLEAIAGGEGGYSPDTSAVDDMLNGRGLAANGKTPLVRTRRAEPSIESDPEAERTAREVNGQLWDQFLDLNEQIMDDRRAGNHAHADALFSERIDVLSLLADETYADMQRQLEGDLPSEDLTPEEWRANVRTKARARAKAQAKAMLKKGINESTAEGLARGMPEQMRLDLLELIGGELGYDPLLGKVGPARAHALPKWAIQTSAAIQKRMLSTLDRERALNVAQLEQERLRALANGDTRTEARLRADRDRELALLEQKVRAQIDAQVQRTPEDKELRRIAAGLTRRLREAIERSKTEADALTNFYRDPLNVRELNGVDRDLARQVLDLRQRMAEARATGDPNLETLQQAHDQVLLALRTKIQERLRKREGKPPTPDAVRAARKLERDLEKEMVGKASPDPAQAELQSMVKQALQRIDRIVKAQERSPAFLKDAKGLLENLAELGGYAERKVQSYQRRLGEAQMLRVFTRPDWKALTEERRKALLTTVDWTDPRSAATLARMMAHPGVWNQVMAIRVASLLSGTSTQLVNIMGNTMMAFAAPVERLGAAVSESVITVGGRRRPREAYYSQIGAEIAGLTAGWPKALQDAKVTWATGISTRQMRDLRTQYSGLITWLPFRPLNLVFKSMAAMDDLFYSLAHSMSMAAEIEGTARRTGRSFAEVRENILDYPELLERSAREADRRIFQQRLEGVLAALNTTRGNPTVAWMIPFLRTTLNLARVGAGLTPYGFVRGERYRRRGDLAMAAEERGRAIMGSLAMMGIGMLTTQGLVTGGGPQDQEKKRSMIEHGWQPWSFKVGGSYVPYQNMMGHWTLPIALAATLAESMGDNVQQGTMDRNAAVLTYFARNFSGVFLQQSGLVAIRDALEAVSDPERYWDSFIDNQMSSLVPYRGFLAMFARAMDPMMKDPQNPLDALLQGIPALSQMVPTKLTAFGEPRPHAGPGVWSFTPIRPSAVQADPETAELMRIGAPLVNKPDRKIEERVLTPTEQRALQVNQGTKVRLALQTLFESPGYQEAPDNRKKVMVEAAKTVAREAALEEMGLQPPPQPSTLPPKYRNIADPKLQAEIDTALRITSAFEQDPVHALPPTERQAELAAAYRDEDLVNPAYRQAQQAQSAASGAARGTIQQAITPDAFANLDGPHQQSIVRAGAVKQQTDQMPRYVYSGQGYGTAQQWDAWDAWLSKWRALPTSSSIKRRYAREGQMLEMMQNQQVLQAQLASADYQRWYGVGRSLSDEQWGQLQQIPRYANRQGQAVGTAAQWAAWDAWLKTWNALPRLDPTKLQSRAIALQLKRLVNPAFKRYVKEADYMGVYGTTDLAEAA